MFQPKIISLFVLGHVLTAWAMPSSNTYNTTQPVVSLLERTIDVLGDSSIYRTQTLTQNYNLLHSDQSLSEAGSQTISFLFKNDSMHQRIDREYQYGDYWLWAFPNLRPLINYSMVLQDGPDAFACFNRGQNSFFSEDPSQPLGYADSYLTEYLLNSARQLALPYLLRLFQADSSSLVSSTASERATGNTYPAIYHQELDLEIIIDNTTFLPYAVRAKENHAVFGLSTSDMLFINYTETPIDNMHHLKLPRRIQTVYNSESVLEDYIIDEITLNPTFTQDIFTATPPTENPNTYFPTSGKPNAPQTDAEYPRSEVHELFEAGLWGGPFGQMFNTSNVKIAPVFPNGTTPQIMNLYVGYPDYIQLLIEMEEGFIITDAPAHRSKIILEYLQTKNKNKNKTITHVVPSHHHRDHAGGIRDYIATGAKLVIPEIARNFYKGVLDTTGTSSDAIIITYNETYPFMLEDQNAKFTSFWHDESPHARDWSYAVATSTSSSSSSSYSTNENNAVKADYVVYVADVISPGPSEMPALKWDSGYARQFLIDAIRDGVPGYATVVGAHGSSGRGLGTEGTLRDLAESIGVLYPE